MALQNSSVWTMHTFLGGTYYIPEYQREYSWEADELGDFWDDLEAARTDRDKMVHFFGQIVVHYDEDEGKKYIIDGQQRTITSVIFLRALQLCYPNGKVRFEGAYEICYGYGPNYPVYGTCYDVEEQQYYKGKIEIKRSGLGYPFITVPKEYGEVMSLERPKLPVFNWEEVRRLGEDPYEYPKRANRI